MNVASWRQNRHWLQALGKLAALSSMHLFAKDPYVPGAVWGSLLGSCKPRECPKGTAPLLSPVCASMVMKSWPHTGRSQLTPRIRLAMGCSPRAAAATTFTLYSGQVREEGEGDQEQALTSPPPSRMFLTKSGTPGSNQNTELWNKLTSHSPSREGECSLDNFGSQPQQK